MMMFRGNNHAFTMVILGTRLKFMSVLCEYNDTRGSEILAANTVWFISKSLPSSSD